MISNKFHVTLTVRSEKSRWQNSDRKKCDLGMKILL